MRNLYPTEVEPLNFSKAGEEAFNSEIPNNNVYDRLGIATEFRIDTAADGTIDTTFYETPLKAFEGYFDVLPPGCSWYCGGRVTAVKASSALSSQAGFSYAAANAHDLDYKTAWVEGVNGPGIGQYLEYEFAPESARVHEIKIANGYVKSEKAWRENGRVKKLKLYLDGKLYAILNLRDERAEHVFKVGPFGYKDFHELDDARKPTKPWILRFEIMEVYPGTKYSDTAISEIHFMGYDGH